MTYLLLFIAILSSGLSGNVYKRLSGKSLSPAMSALYPALWFFPLAVVFFIGMALGGNPLAVLVKPALLWPAMGGGFGLALAASILIESMKRNSMAISVILVNLNFVIPVLLSTIFLQEQSGWLQMAGMVLCIVVIVLINFKKEKGQGGTKASLLLPCAACLANGAVNFCIKLHQNQMGDASLNAYYALMYLFSGLFCLLFWVVLRSRSQQILPGSKAAWASVLKDAIMLGLCNGICFYMTGLLAGRMNAAAQFTILTASSIALSLFVGAVFQKARITLKTALSFLFCLLAIFLEAF